MPDSSETWDLSQTTTTVDTCPCRRPFRLLEDGGGGGDEEVALWEVIYTCVVLFFMFAALLSDRFGADSVMIVAVTAYMAAGIITISEGLSGFSNEGLITILTLFVVAEGISKTGALDWYMGKLLGRPKTTASAQLRLMVPISVVSAFLNNTPVVAVMIPIVQKWAKNINISAQQLLIPLSFASILGGTCTLIGTSTNLVVVGLLDERYPNDPEMNIGLFDLGVYGVPIAIAGICYLLLASPFLLPGGSRQNNSTRGTMPFDSQEDILLGARLAPWSPAAGRSVKRSGLRDTGGIFLVSVHRAATGNVHRAVGQDFVLNVGDILYFTGLVEGFGEFCEEHGMEVLTNEISDNPASTPTEAPPENQQDVPSLLRTNDSEMFSEKKRQLLPVFEGEDGDADATVPMEVGVTKESLMNADEAERSRAITRMIDTIRGVGRDEPTADENRAFSTPRKGAQATRAHKVVVTSEHDFVIVGVDTRDRPGLLLDISKGLARLNLNIRHTEASVVGSSSISIWRCEVVDTDLPDLEEIWSVLNALLEADSGSQAVKERGLRVMRAVVNKTSSLIGKPASTVDFRKAYRAAIVAIQKGGKNVAISSVVFGPGDVLVLQVAEDSPLLKVPPADFYKRAFEVKDAATLSRTSSVASFVNKFAMSVGRLSTDNLEALHQQKESEVVYDEEVAKTNREKKQEINNNDSGDEGFYFGADGDNVPVKDETMLADMVSSMEEVNNEEEAWRDLQVVFLNEERAIAEGGGTREFLTAMEVAPKSKLAKRTVAEVGLDKLPGVFLVSIDRPTTTRQTNDEKKPKVTVVASPSKNRVSSDSLSEVASLRTAERIFSTISPDTPLEEGDVLWFAGSASAVGDLRKIPGLISYESEEVAKINEKVHDRRLVEAVIARRGPLVGKTVKEIRFRTRFGAAVIAVHRDGKRIHEHPGKIKLQAGDVLLLEAGPSFIKKSVDNDRSFALLAEVEDSAPPRLKLLIPALVLTVAMLAVYTAGVASLLVCALVAAILMVCIGILSEQEARDAVKWDVYMTIATAFAIGIALVNSGVAGGVAGFMVDVGEAVGMGDAGLLGAVYLATFLISNIVTNNAAAALIFPIAMDAAEQTGVDRLIMSYCVMLGASASFMSPFGYTTNLLIYGPGGYKTKDFLSIGTPMQLILWVLSVLFLSMPSNSWWVSWLGTSVALVVVVLTRILDPSQWFHTKSQRRNSKGGSVPIATPSPTDDSALPVA